MCTCCSQLQRQVLIQREVSREEGHGASHGPRLPGAKWPSVAVRPMNWSQQYLCYLPAGWDALAGWCLTLEWQQSIVLSTSLQYQAHLFVFLGVLKMREWVYILLEECLLVQSVQVTECHSLAGLHQMGDKKKGEEYVTFQPYALHTIWLVGGISKAPLFAVVGVFMNISDREPAG